MLRFLLLLLFTFLGFLIFYDYSVYYRILGAIAGFAASFAVIFIEMKSQKRDFTKIFGGAMGIIFGLVIGWIIASKLQPLAFIGTIPFLLLQFSVLALFGYLGLIIFYQRSAEFVAMFKLGGGQSKSVSAKEPQKYKILDTSVIIDGRIADVCESGFLEGVMIIPRFVLIELQQIADSSDSIKRQRGRRGLDILNKMQKGKKSVVQISDADFTETNQVDEKLVYLAKDMGAKIITNDYNLNKVAEIQGVEVLNINDLSNAVKPIVLPGETLTVTVIKEGKDENQGVAYLEDGTMVVVDSGRNFLGKKIDVVVTSVLQTAAGRMIFAK